MPFSSENGRIAYLYYFNVCTGESEHDRRAGFGLFVIVGMYGFYGRTSKTRIAGVDPVASNHATDSRIRSILIPYLPVVSGALQEM